MRECICSSCKNLKSVIDENSGIETFNCKYGYPSGQCESCEDGECDVECGEFIEDDGSVELVKVKCARCGKELEKLADDADEGECYCVDCFLK